MKLVFHYVANVSTSDWLVLIKALMKKVTMNNDKSKPLSSTDNDKSKPSSSSKLLSITRLFSLAKPVENTLVGSARIDEEEWVKTAIRHLINKLRLREGAIEELDRALSFPNIRSKCVTIPRNINGRLQILYRSNFPHVLYCRVWRWPDLKDHFELTSLNYCQFPYLAYLTEICINPYHYQRIENPELPTVSVLGDVDLEPEYLSLPFEELDQPTAPLNIGSSTNNLTTNNVNPESSSTSVRSPATVAISNQQSLYANLVEFSSPHHSSTDSNAFKIPYTENLQTPMNVTMTCQEQPVWASIIYYERTRRIGEVFYCRNTSIIVDGFTDPNRNNDRFCLGHFTNVYRDSLTENTLERIGKGIQLCYVNGEVYINRLSDSAVFFQSRNFKNDRCISKIREALNGRHIRLFNKDGFAHTLSRCATKGYAAVFALRKTCTIYISFVKSWGNKYHRRVTHTPCWIEVHLYKPLQMIDEVLNQLGDADVVID
ncbi:hypothetical protein FQR65_LT00030 [Abscondita terminalis]|nr:hypothetical protein FQR65_LT00030 [Abscondita terminalis]